jgi:hypothetical protein
MLLVEGEGEGGVVGGLLVFGGEVGGLYCVGLVSWGFRLM